MAKIPMKQIMICGLIKDSDQIMSLLQRAGVVDIETSAEKVASFDTSEGIAKSSYGNYMKECESALEIINRYSKDENAGLLASFEDTKPMSLGEYDERVKNVTKTNTIAKKINNLAKEIAEARAQIVKCETKIEQMKPWMELDIKLNYSGTAKTRTFVGSFKGDIPTDVVYQNVCSGLDENIMKYVDVIPLSKSKDMTCVMVITLQEYEQEVETQLKKIEFENSPMSKLIPKDEVGFINDEIKGLEEKVATSEKTLTELGNERDNLKFASDHYAMLASKYETFSKLEKTNKTCIISGYVPANYAKALEDKINSKVEAYVEITDPAPNANVPVALKNGFWADPMETVVESYSLPNNNEIDPSKILSIFYYALFGLMLSDAGYGLLLFLGTGFVLLNVKNIKPEMKKMMKLFCFGGMFAMFWGLLLGSFFGNSVDVIAQYVLGTKEVPNVFIPFLKKLHIYWFNPVEEPMRLLVFAFAIGLVHLFTGLFIKGYMLLKQKAFLDFVYDVVFWIMFVGGGVVYLLTMNMVTDMIGMATPLGEPVPTISGIIMGIGCLGVVLTSGRESKNWFKRLLKGAYGAYGITGWLSDVLSYSRLLALGLATGIIAEVFNTMGSMIKVPVLGLIVFIIVFVVGHLLNLGINVLGAYVHTNRLQFVEFFGKFYEGGGKKFTPFSENTKYYHIKED